VGFATVWRLALAESWGTIMDGGRALEQRWQAGVVSVTQRNARNKVMEVQSFISGDRHTRTGDGRDCCSSSRAPLVSAA
jgi:hypothetical protein